jgi:hypothetical protein
MQVLSCGLRKRTKENVGATLVVAPLPPDAVRNEGDHKGRPTCPWKQRSDHFDVATLEIDLGNSSKDRHSDLEARAGIVDLLYDAIE